MHVMTQLKLEQALTDTGEAERMQNPSRFVGYFLISYGCFIHA